MEQSKLVSLIESIVTVCIGFVISLLVWILIIIPVWKLDVDMYDNLSITAVFTVFAIARQYTIRRFFAKDMHKAVVNIARRFK